MVGAVETILARYPLEAMKPGDAFIANDPYLAGGSHLPDISIITPIHHEGEVRFFCGNIAHHADVGGRTPGSTSGTSRSIFEEGIRIPVIRIAREGAIDEDLLELIACNTRDPEERMLDLRTQVGTNMRGGTMLLQLVDRMGWPAVAQAIEDILTYTRRRLQNRIAALPDGEYRFERAMDDDGFPGAPVPIVCTARIAGDTIEFDFEGSGPEARGAINLPDSALKASVHYCVRAVLDPGLMPNQGSIDPIRIKAPQGSIVNPRPPHAVAARAVTSNRLCGAIFGALYQALPPEAAMASCNDFDFRSLGVRLALQAQRHLRLSREHGRRRRRVRRPRRHGRRPRAHRELDESARRGTGTGISAASRRILPRARFRRRRSPPRRHWAWRARSVFVKDGTIFSARSDAHIVPAPGINGGLASGVTRILRNPGTDREEVLHSKASGLVLDAGETIRVETLGGGGYGNPRERSTANLAADLRQGKVSRAAAERDYGIEKVEDALKLV